MPSLTAIITTIYESPLATAIRESSNLFPALQTFHILGTILLAGAITVVDLHLLGVLLRKVTPYEIARAILPITWLGFAVMLISGGLLFIAQSARIYANTFLQIKLVLLIAALGNAALFHATTFKHVATPQAKATIPFSARVFASISLVLWAAIITTGRFIAYY
jgi:hypothetical protein